MNRNNLYLLRLYTALGNYFVLNGVFVLALVIRFPDSWVEVFGSNNYIALLLFVNLSWVFITNLLRYYRPMRLNLKTRRRIFLFAQVAVLHFLLVLAFNGLIKTYYSRLFLIYLYIGLIFFLPIVEVASRLFINWYQKQKGFTNRILLAGSSSSIPALINYFDDLDESEKLSEVGVLDASSYELREMLSSEHVRRQVNELYISISTIPEPVLKELVTFCENNLIRVRLIVDYPRLETKPLELVRYSSIPVLNVPITPLDEPGNKMIKRTFDILFSLLVIILVLSWLYPILALIIKLTSTGPVLFLQKRTGVDNKQFDCFKFRSMRVNQEADKVQATSNDPRITGVGRFMRRTSLDEMPQFFNVLRGEMSVVGPRPHMLKHTEEYAQLVGNFMQRHAIRPGVTGLAQVKGYRGEITQFEHLANRVKYDRFYVENWSLALDLKIIIRTVAAVFKGGAV